MNFVANQAKDQLIDFAKSQLIIKLEEKLNQGDEGIKALFVELKDTLKNYTVLDKNVLQIILGAICINPKLAEEVKTNLKEQIDKIDFSTELEKMKEKIPGISDDMKLKIDALPETLKTELNKLFGELIVCPVATKGGSKKRDRKQKRRQRKTKKRIHKKSRGRRQYSRK
jgi:hypothetical protein